MPQKSDIKVFKLLTESQQEKIDQRPKNNTLWNKVKAMSNTDKSEISEEFALHKALTIDPNAKRNPKKRDLFDITILGHQVEVRFATQDVSDHYQFNGVIHNRINNEYFLFIGLSNTGNIYFVIHSAKKLISGEAGNICPINRGGDETGSYKYSRTEDQLYEISKFREVMEKVLG